MGSCSSEKNTYMRLALKKLLESKALSYLCDEEIKRAQAAFISQEPGESAHVYFFEVPSGRTDFKRSVVANVTFAWQVVKEKEPDGEGNLWASYTFSHTLSMRETYNLQGPTLTKWLQCVGAIGELDEEIRSLDLPDLVREMTHSREEWAMLERREKKAAGVPVKLFTPWLDTVAEVKFIPKERAGTQNAGLAIGGFTPAGSSVEEYNGSIWTTGVILTNAGKRSNSIIVEDTSLFPSVIIRRKESPLLYNCSYRLVTRSSSQIVANEGSAKSTELAILPKSYVCDSSKSNKPEM